MASSKSSKKTAAPTPADRARTWWERQTRANRIVISPAESPSPAVTKILRQDSLVMEVANRRAWILVATKPADRRAVFLANYWPVTALVLARYAPAAVVGVGAVRLHLGDFSPPEGLPAYQAANKSEYTLPLEPGFFLRLRPHDISNEQLVNIDGPGGAVIPALAPADLLATLDEPEIIAGIEPISAWLRHLVIRTPDLKRAVNEWPRPKVLRRLADMANALGNTVLGTQLDEAANRISEHNASPTRTGVGTRIQIPEAVLSQPQDSGTPWLDEQVMRLARQRTEVSVVLRKAIATLPTFSAKVLAANAEESKAYDAYHSITMDGYRTSPEVVEAIVGGEPRGDGPQDKEGLRATTAVQGYSIAFDRVVRLAKTPARITASTILDLHEDLFRPSVDARIVEAGQLRAWRTGPVSLSGWRHAPPSPGRIRDLIDGLEEFDKQPELDALTRAMLVHLEFVTIHPFLDGNGRLGRLLMNLVLVSGGLPWVTVRADERVPFFKAVERAQVDGDTEHLIRYLWHLIRQAITDLESKRSRKGRK